MSTIYNFHQEMVPVPDVAAGDRVIVADVSAGLNKYARVDQLMRGNSLTAFSDATAGNITYTAAQILGGIIVRDPNGASRTDVLPTAALLVAAMTTPAVGDVVKCYLINGADAAETVTLTAGAGGAFDTNQVAASRLVAQNTSRYLHIRLTNVTLSSEAYVVYM